MLPQKGYIINILTEKKSSFFIVLQGIVNLDYSLFESALVARRMIIFVHIHQRYRLLRLKANIGSFNSE